MIGVYKITNRKTNECYVGASKHIRDRWAEHFCKGYGAKHSKAFQDAIDELGKSGFDFEVLEECELSELRERENYWINKLRPEYNTITDWYSASEETREKIRQSLTGKKHPPDVVARRKASIRAYREIHPQTNEGHRKKVAIQEETVVVFESVKSAAEHMSVDASTMTHALKRGGRVKGKKVWYVV